MKYPAKQFEELVNCLKKFAVYLNLKESNPHTLHYMVYQQYSEGQKHNHLYCTVNGLKRFFQLNEEEKEDCIKFIVSDYDFQLYPNGCNDNHIETAMRKALKEMNI